MNNAEFDFHGVRAFVPVSPEVERWVEIVEEMTGVVYWSWKEAFKVSLTHPEASPEVVQQLRGLALLETLEGTIQEDQS